jgi:hypothetical protein
MTMSCECDCDCDCTAGFTSMTTEELIMLKNTLHKAAKYDEAARGTLVAVTHELRRRET